KAAATRQDTRTLGFQDLEIMAYPHPALLQHDSGGAILFSRQADCPFHLFFAQTRAADFEVNVQRFENSWHCVGPDRGDFRNTITDRLTRLAQNADNVECR